MTDGGKKKGFSGLDDLVSDANEQPVSLFERTTRSVIDRIRELHRPGSDADDLDRRRAASKVKRWTDRETGDEADPDLARSAR